MGYLFCGCGFLCYNEVIFYLSVHALNKAFLFILVGYVVHFFSGNTDMRIMGSLYIYAIDVVFVLIFISINLTGLPLSSGFVAKEFLLFQTMRDGAVTYFIRLCWFISFLFTPVYMLLLNLLVVFYSRSGTISAHSASELPFKIANPFSINLLATNSLFYSKLTALLLVFFLVVVNFSGELLLTVLYSITSLNTPVYNFSFTGLNYNLLSSTFSQSYQLSNLLNYVVILSLYAGVRGLSRLFYTKQPY